MQDYRCLSWYPIDLLSGEIDAYAASQEAEVSFGKVPDNAKLCLIGEDYVTTEDRFYCAIWSDTNRCNVVARIPAGTRVKITNLNGDTEKLLWGKDNGSGYDETWFLETNTNLTFVENSPDVQKGGNPLSIIFQSVSPQPNDNLDTTNTLGREDYKYATWDLHWDLTTGDKPNILTDLVSIFDTLDNVIEKYFWDERVDGDGNNISATLESTPAMYFDGTIQSEGGGLEDNCGYDCGDCGNSKADCNACPAGFHQIRIDCDMTCHCGLSRCRDSWRQCNPLEYNYYVKYEVASSNVTLLCGTCDQNCKGGDKGIQCLENPLLENDYYNEVLTIYNNVAPVGDIDACGNIASTTYNITFNKAKNDCRYVDCIINSNIADPNVDHSCNSYADSFGDSCGQFIRDNTPPPSNIISSQLMHDKNDRCLRSNVFMYPGVAGLQNPPDPNGTCNLGTICGNYNINTCNQCTEIVLDLGFDYSNEQNTVDCGPCGKTCKTYIDLDEAIYNSNNFYLNWLTPEQIDLPPKPTSVCKPDDVNIICPEILSGDFNHYSLSTPVRFSGISSTTVAVFDTVHEPFSAAVGGEALLRDLIYANSRPGQGDKFNDFYADLDGTPVEDLNTAKSRLENVLIKVVDEDFHEYDNMGNWPMPIWGGSPYWNIASSLDPTIKQVDYDGIEFSEGEPGISINNISNKHILSSGGDLYAYLMFYAYTATGTAPIQEIVIDWTGIPGNELVLRGPFKNHKNDCIRKCGMYYKDINWNDATNSCVGDSDCGIEQCFAQTWGDHEDACVEDNKNANQDGFFSYSYIFTCDALNDYWYEDCTDYDSNIQGGCCVYTPRVTITDNWGNSKTENLGQSLDNCPDGNQNTCSVIIIPK